MPTSAGGNWGHVFPFLSFAFLRSMTNTVMTLKNMPRKNQSHGLRPVFCAHKAQRAPQTNTATPTPSLLEPLCSSADTRCSKSPCANTRVGNIELEVNTNKKRMTWNSFITLEYRLTNEAEPLRNKRQARVSGTEPNRCWQERFCWATRVFSSSAQKYKR